MALYSRANYDADLDAIERANQGITRLVAARAITGFDALKATSALEEHARYCKGKLLATRSILAGNDAKRLAEENRPVNKYGVLLPTIEAQHVKTKSTTTKVTVLVPTRV